MEGVYDTDLLRAWTLKSSLNFTRYFFKEGHNMKFIIGKHHKLICDALDDVLDGKCNKLIINIAPRFGKCIAPFMLVLTEDGYKRADRIQVGDMLISYRDGQAVKARCKGVGTAYKPSYKLVMKSGHYFVCSYDHPMLTPFGYVEARDLEEGDSIYAYNEHRFYGNKDFYLDKVSEIEQVGNMDLIDLEVEGTHNFIANGLVSHNTELAVKNFIAMGFAVNPAARFIHLSYSANLAEDNSMAVKNIVQSEAYQALFPARITYGKNLKSQWDTDQGGGLYATSTLGQITGFGAGLVEEEGADYRFGGAIIIDDPIKPEDALSDVVRERVNRRFETTIRNRVNSRNTPIIIIMQRLHEHDLCGYLQEIERDDWRVVSQPAIQINEDGEREALWPYKLTLEELDKINLANSFVFETQYLQNPTPMEGLMYPHPFKTYEVLPNVKIGTICNYTDSADTGADYLCSIDYLATDVGYYVMNVTFTKKPMEFTEPATAEMVTKDNVRYCVIESNNGGRAFMRNVERLARQMGNQRTTFIPFTQTKNKAVRIFTRSAEVNNMIIFPVGWQRMWPEFAAQILSYRKEGRNAHDDGPDVLTGIIERGSLVGGASDEQILGDFL